MTTTTAPVHANREAAREARLEAAKAARATAPTFGPEVVVNVADVQPGDFLVRVHPVDRFRGVRYESIVTGRQVVHAGQRLPGGLAIAPLVAQGTGIVFDTGRHGEASWGSSIHRLHGQATIRRRS